MSEYIVGTDGHEGHWLTGEEIVRCRDCKHFATNIHGSYCMKSVTTLSKPDGFCKWGERRSE